MRKSLGCITLIKIKTKYMKPNINIILCKKNLNFKLCESKLRMYNSYKNKNKTHETNYKYNLM